MKQKSLGVLVTSEKHGSHLRPLFRAADRKKIILAIHLQGEGVLLGLKERYKEVLKRSHLTICRRSAEKLGIGRHLETLYPHAMAPNQISSMAVNRCTRQIVL